MKGLNRNVMIGIIQFIFATFGMIQLLNNAVLMAIISIFLVYLVGAFEQ